MTNRNRRHVTNDQSINTYVKSQWSLMMAFLLCFPFLEKTWTLWFSNVIKSYRMWNNIFYHNKWLRPFSSVALRENYSLSSRIIKFSEKHIPWITGSFLVSESLHISICFYRDRKLKMHNASSVLKVHTHVERIKRVLILFIKAGVFSDAQKPPHLQHPFFLPRLKRRRRAKGIRYYLKSCLRFYFLLL